jgi:FeS assembly SUF system regulator
MLRILKLSDYATGLLARLAREPGRCMSAQLLAAELALPLPTTAKLLKKLVQAGLVQSTRGAWGGYSLARPPQGISLAEVIAAIEGPLALTECTAPNGSCALESRCATRSRWQSVNDVVFRALASFNIAEMTQLLPTHPPQKE